ncbi:MAG: hypothetical protein Q8Q24_00990, partial [bacterium]|nr:hypothetical protein [bacterium]
GKIVQKTLLLAKEKLPKNEAEELENLYLLTREMLEAKDYTLGRRDIKLFQWWYPLTEEIVMLAKKDLGINLKEEEKTFLMIPWSLESYLPDNLKEIL